MALDAIVEESGPPPTIGWMEALIACSFGFDEPRRRVDDAASEPIELGIGALWATEATVDDVAGLARRLPR